jgi:hypothetical protein
MGLDYNQYDGIMLTQRNRDQFPHHLAVLDAGSQELTVSQIRAREYAALRTTYLAKRLRSRKGSHGNTCICQVQFRQSTCGIKHRDECNRDNVNHGVLGDNQQ